MAQPPGLPEQLIGAAPDAFFGHFLERGTRLEAIPADVRPAYLEASKDAVTSIVADYRASATIDVEHDTVDRGAGARLGSRSPSSSRTGVPLSASTPSPGGKRGHRTWTTGRSPPGIHGRGIPADVVKALRDLLAR